MHLINLYLHIIRCQVRCCCIIHQCFVINKLTSFIVLYPDTPCEIIKNPVLSFDKACIILFWEVPNEEELYAIFQPPFDVVEKCGLEPPNMVLFSGDSVDVKLIPDLYKSPVIYVFPVI